MFPKDDEEKTFILIIYRITVAFITALRHRYRFLPDLKNITIILEEEKMEVIENGKDHDPKDAQPEKK